MTVQEVRRNGRAIPVVQRRRGTPGRVDLLDQQDQVIGVAVRTGTAHAPTPWEWALTYGLAFGDPEVSCYGHGKTLAECSDTVAARIIEHGLVRGEPVTVGSGQRRFTVVVEEGEYRVNADAVADALRDARLTVLSVSEQFENTNTKGRTDHGG